MANKFINSNSFFNNNEGSASWSDQEGFYKRVNWLAIESHNASNDDEDIVDYLMCLEQFHIEIEGAIPTIDERKQLEALRLKTKQWVYSSKNTRANLPTKREHVGKYHRLINILAHKYGLYLRKSISASLDSWDNE